MTSEQKLQKARVALVMNHPFWASLMLPMPLVVDHSCPTAYTDGRVIGYNPDYIATLSESVVVSLMAHEVCHPAMIHHLRESGREHARWNQACDYAVNLVLKDAGGFEIPDNWLLNEDYRDMSSEKIYSLLEEQSPHTHSTGDCGPGEVRESTGGGECSKRQEEGEWKVRVTAAAQIAKSRGELSEGLERWVKELVTPRVNWRAVLASFMEEALSEDYSWLKPNSRYASGGLYLPSLVPLDGGNVVVIIDTSGSISESDMEELASELTGIVSSYDIEMVVLYVDTEVRGVQRFTAADLPLKLEPKGGGGTDFRPGFEWAESCGKIPQCCVYLTDGWCSSFPEQFPSYPVLWVIGGDFQCKNFDPPFGEVILIG